MQLDLRIRMNSSLYLRDPEMTDLGQNIIRHSIELIYDLGFEHFTFKKLAEHIGTTEASIYRYFENKHRLLTYLVSWYWSWIEYRIIMQIRNMSRPKEKIQAVLQIICTRMNDDLSTSHINEELLQQIVVADGSKAYLTKHVTEDNQSQFFKPYKELSMCIAELVQDACPNYPHPKSLATTWLEMSHSFHFYKQHLPSLTEFSKGPDDEQMIDFMKSMLF
ncbi:MAG: TetR/AcrR family transcriptional regulator [Bacteroidota bacterium]|nr:MAG: TetR/AcrR family transcriptional regulator [Bacteroidota bacterium]